jgi:hypothetical protein
MNIDINYCKNEDNKNRINNRLRALLTNPMYRINDETKRKINDILQFLDENTCRELLENNINFKRIYDLFSQILEQSYLDENTIISSKRTRIDDFDLNASFNNLGLRGENTATLIDKINEIHKFLFPGMSIEDSFKKIKNGGSFCYNNISKPKATRKQKRKSKTKTKKQKNQKHKITKNPL